MLPIASEKKYNTIYRLFQVRRLYLPEFNTADFRTAPLTG
jgi:hypothetical protein